MLLFDTSGIEAWVAENNPKYANRIIKQLKAFKKSHNLDDSYDPYKAAYGSMLSHAAANPPIRLSSRCTLTGISATLINSESLQMVLALSVTLLSTTRIF